MRAIYDAETVNGQIIHVWSGLCIQKHSDEEGNQGGRIERKAQK